MGLYDQPIDEQHRALALLTTLGEQPAAAQQPARPLVAPRWAGAGSSDAQQALQRFQVA
jgi:hypothetical protein